MAVQNKIERLRAMCAQDPNNTFAFYTLAMELRKTDVPAAIAVFEDIRTRHPDYVANYYQYAKALEESGDPARAKTIYREGMAEAQKAGNMHAFGELQGALEMLG